jgi:hypothetical protein
MAGMKHSRRLWAAGHESAVGSEQSERRTLAERAMARREHVERRLGFLTAEESRLALAGNFEAAQETARERRYWQFVRALLGAPTTVGAPGATVH